MMREGGGVCSNVCRVQVCGVQSVLKNNHTKQPHQQHRQKHRQNTTTTTKKRDKQKQTQPDKAALAEFGLDLVEGRVRNNVEAGVLEPALSKTKMVQFATEAAITVLRIDDLIRLDAPPEAPDDD